MLQKLFLSPSKNPQHLLHAFMALVITGWFTSIVQAQLNSPYGINAHSPQGSTLAPLLNEVQACGINWIRIDFVWAWVETSQNNFNWTVYDNIVVAAAARNLKIFATIGHTPQWATSGSEGSGVPNNAADYYDICYRAALRYAGSIDHWGLWNEPNLSGFWAGTRAQYINDILINGANAIHAANPNAKACGPELAHLTSGDQDWYYWLRDSIQQAAGKLDIVTHHVYCSSGYSSCTDKLNANTSFGGNPSYWTWVSPSVREVLAYVNWTGPVWLTEIGWTSASSGETSQANNYTGILTDWFTGNSSRSWINKVFFYELNDSTAFPDLSWGILGPDPTWTRKQAFYAYQNFITAYPPPGDPPVIAEVTPDPDVTVVGTPYMKQLTLVQGTVPITWSVVSAPSGVQVSSSGYVSGWTPTSGQGDTTQTITVRATNAQGYDDESWQVYVYPLPDQTIASFPFTSDAQSWTLAGWKAGTFSDGTMVWDSASGNPAGNLKANGSGATNGNDSCTREGASATRVISTASYTNIQIEYDVIAILNSAPASGCVGGCTSSVLEGSCEDKLVVYYSTTGTNGPWIKVQELNEGDDLPTSWTRKTISLASVSAANNNANFALQFKWQFNTTTDTGRIDNITIKGSGGSGNTAPQVNAGTDQTITLPSNANLDGTVTDDGLPNPPGTVTVTWSKTSGPGTVTFGNANAVDTTASFSTSGTYVLRLTASDSQLSSYDELTITVNPTSGPPAKATSPSPPNGAIKISTSSGLGWTAGTGATSHKVYFGTTNPPTYQTQQTGTTYDPGPMDRLTLHYWRIDEVNAQGTTTGDLWTFTTISAPGDFDQDGDVDLEDFGYLQRCYSGNDVPPETGCEDANLDGDNDVDQNDFTIFQNCFGGAGRPSGC